MRSVRPLMLSADPSRHHRAKSTHRRALVSSASTLAGLSASLTAAATAAAQSQTDLDFGGDGSRIIIGQTLLGAVPSQQSGLTHSHNPLTQSPIGPNHAHSFPAPGEALVPGPFAAGPFAAGPFAAAHCLGCPISGFRASFGVSTGSGFDVGYRRANPDCRACACPFTFTCPDTLSCTCFGAGIGTSTRVGIDLLRLGNPDPDQRRRCGSRPARARPRWSGRAWYRVGSLARAVLWRADRNQR